ncbi:short-chain collagen C4-like [Saccostrea echinata]|uniref:short-chain collagen C4-like n=1 Tax=Saccostrea echinata TaxID=191078 RepID=UPI002A7F83FC|nr:short-chain collagen C4-like [Saccostrea echinata]
MPVSGQEKRILLNDPDMMNSRLEALEHELQALKSALLETKTRNLAQDAKINSQESEIQDLKNQLSIKTSGSTYIRWGHKTCPVVNGTSLLYAGFTAGRHYREAGSGVNTLCLPHDPESAPAGLPSDSSWGRLYGAEYDFSFKNIAVNDDVPCAVCFAHHASSSIMIPAKRSCPLSWTKQYSGFLTSDATLSNNVYYGSEYLCVDENPEYMTDGARQNNYDGRLFFPVHAVCGSLPCPPYRDLQKLACVVCTM